jgi:hypothetical protein
MEGFDVLLLSLRSLVRRCWVEALVVKGIERRTEKSPSRMIPIGLINANANYDAHR